MRKKGGEGDVCSICLKIFSVGVLDVTLELCNHKFHKECIDQWMLITKTCPICRADIIEPGYKFEDVDVFKRYINRKLEDYTEDPTQKLIHELNEIGTKYTPYAVADIFMEFVLETNLRGEHRFKFTRLIPPNEEIRAMTNKKYFKYEINISYFFEDSPDPLVESLMEWQ